MTRVYLKFPYKAVDSPYYKTLVEYPPKSVKIISERQKIGIIQSPNFFSLNQFIKNLARKGLSLVKIPNLTLTFYNETDIVHCAHCLLLNRIPWVVDVEHFWTFSASYDISASFFGRRIISKMLSNSFCKKILPWTEAAKLTIEKGLGNSLIYSRKIKEKIEVVYPAVPIYRRKYRKSNNKITLLFIGRYFYQKGGLFVAEAFRRLKLKYGDQVRPILISFTVPQLVKKKYWGYFEIYNSISSEVLFNGIYPSTDIYVYPGFSDTFGFSLLEAMSFEIPIITVDSFARREIVEDNRGGFVIERPKKFNIYNIGVKGEKLIEELVKKTSLLIEDPSLRRKMGKYNRQLIEKDKFSIKERNKKLKRIYEEALRY